MVRRKKIVIMIMDTTIIYGDGRWMMTLIIMNVMIVMRMVTGVVVIVILSMVTMVVW